MKTFSYVTLATCVSVAALLTSNGAAAATSTTATDSASWSATATKDTSAAFVISQGKSSLTFDYSASSKQFSTDSDTLTASVIGDGDTGYSGFTIVASLSGDTLSNGTDTIYVEPTIGGKDITTAGATIYDYASVSTSSFAGITPLTTTTSQVSDTATVTFTPYSSSDFSSRDFSSYSDGTYTGTVGINFIATWTGASSSDDGSSDNSSSDNDNG
ncbi:MULTISPECIES: common pilus major fimbrillin subunit EcpA [Gibbsiella]|uniref:Common pilus major fimbrillin subunit EcpA n=1 Tax=Gibbsiella dentisursi TaxID=796890 RepID=A0ABP7M6Q2_9GAMM|nr:common pilus major fimbrillin subunit EcpA [Gibbsiella quercinecans]